MLRHGGHGAAPFSSRRGDTRERTEPAAGPVPPQVAAQPAAGMSAQAPAPRMTQQDGQQTEDAAQPVEYFVAAPIRTDSAGRYAGHWSPASVPCAHGGP